MLLAIVHFLFIVGKYPVQPGSDGTSVLSQFLSTSPSW